MTFYDLPVKLISPFQIDHCANYLESLNGQRYQYAQLTSTVAANASDISFYLHAHTGFKTPRNAFHRYRGRIIQGDIAIKGYLAPLRDNKTLLDIEIAEPDKTYYLSLLKHFVIATVLFVLLLMISGKFPLFIAVIFAAGFGGLIVGATWMQRPYDASGLVEMITDGLNTDSVQHDSD